MKCFTHKDSEAVGACVLCGKGVCRACVSEAEGGRVVCSLECADRLGDRWRFVAGCFLLGFGGFLVALSLYFSTRQVSGGVFLGVVTVLYGLGCLLVGAGVLSVDDSASDRSFEPYYRIGKEIRWRAGLALHQAHRFRTALAETLTLHSGQTGERLSLSELEWAEAEVWQQVFERICSVKEIPDWMAASPQAAARDFAEQAALAHSLGWTYFAERQRRGQPYEAQQKMLLELIGAAHILDSGEFRLGVLNRKLSGKA